MSRVAIRARHLLGGNNPCSISLMNFNFWVELDGEVITNVIDQDMAERIAQKLASAVGETQVDHLDFWEGDKP